MATVKPSHWYCCVPERKTTNLATNFAIIFIFSSNPLYQAFFMYVSEVPLQWQALSTSLLSSRQIRHIFSELCFYMSLWSLSEVSCMIWTSVILLCSMLISLRKDEILFTKQGTNSYCCLPYLRKVELNQIVKKIRIMMDYFSKVLLKICFVPNLPSILLDYLPFPSIPRSNDCQLSLH